MSLRQWLSVIGLACAAFIFNTSEFIPIGLLTGIAADFGVTEAKAGLLISVYAWMVMLLSLPLMLLVSRMEMRRLMLCVIFLFVGFQALSSVSGSYMALMVSRIGVACTHAVFWSIVSPLAVSVVPERRRTLALSMIVTGSSIAMIVGLPLGRVVGLCIGWRMTFMCIGAFALLAFMFLAVVLPKVPGGGFSVRELPVILKRPALLGAYLMAFAIPTAHYAAYSYIEPFLMQVTGMADGSITLTLMLFGCAGIIGSYLFSRFYPQNPVRFHRAALWGIAVSLLMLYPASGFGVTEALLCVFWGVAITAFNVAFQAEIINNSPVGSSAVAMSIFSGIYNLGIGSGTLVGGMVCTHLSISYTGCVGGLLAVVAVLLWGRKMRGLYGKAAS